MQAQALIATIAIFLASTLTAPAKDHEGATRLRVKGIVCSFCARGIEKKFEALPEVRSVKIDLRSGVVTLHENAGQEISDETLRKLVTEAGYDVESIERAK